MRQILGVILIIGTSPLLIVCAVIKALNAFADALLEFMTYIMKATWGIE